MRTRFKTILVPNQMAPDGSFPRELKRTKPYSYSIFNLDVMATLCESLRAPGEDLFRFVTEAYAKPQDFSFHIWRTNSAGPTRKMWSTSMHYRTCAEFALLWHRMLASRIPRTLETT
jgi:Alginate lyase